MLVLSSNINRAYVARAELHVSDRASDFGNSKNDHRQEFGILLHIKQLVTLADIICKIMVYI